MKLIDFPQLRPHTPHSQRASHQRNNEPGQDICWIMDTKLPRIWKMPPVLPGLLPGFRIFRASEALPEQRQRMLWCDLTGREILWFGDHRDESFDFRKRPWSCYYIFEKQIGNDRPEDQGQSCRIACFSCLWNSRRTTAQRIQNHPPFPRNVTDFINGVSISVLKYRWIRRRISPSSCCIDCKIFICISFSFCCDR